MAKRNRENRITHLYNGVVDAVNNLSLGVLGDLGSDILARERAETKEFLRGGMECRVRSACQHFADRLPKGPSVAYADTKGAALPVGYSQSYRECSSNSALEFVAEQVSLPSAVGGTSLMSILPEEGRALYSSPKAMLKPGSLPRPERSHHGRLIRCRRGVREVSQPDAESRHGYIGFRAYLAVQAFCSEKGRWPQMRG